MSAKPVVLREQAQHDINDAIERYLTEAGPAVTPSLSLMHSKMIFCETGMRPKEWLAALRSRVGYSRPALPGRREVPYLTLCIEREAQVDVWRVLHGARDVPARMFEPP